MLLDNLDLDLNKYQGFIFDLDGTLINSMPYHVQAWIEVGKMHNFDVDPALIYEMGGVSSRDVVVKFKEMGHDVGDIDEFVKQKVLAYRRNLDKVQTFKSVEECIFFAKEKNIKVAAGTGTQRINAEDILNKLKLRSYFDAVISADDVKNHKPFPDTFLACAQNCHIAPESCLVFEDGPLGVKAALTAKMDCIELLNGKVIKVHKAY